MVADYSILGQLVLSLVKTRIQKDGKIGPRIKNTIVSLQDNNSLNFVTKR